LSRLRISLITPTLNQGQFIERTIRSVLDQAGDFELDYRVLDAGSTDQTISILRRYEDRLVWTSEPDQGQVDAINKGLRVAKGDIVGWINSDDILLPGALQRVADAFTTHPDVEWLHGRCEIIGIDDKPIRRWISQYKDFRAKRHSLDRLLTENYISQMTAFWRRSAHDDIGYLDPSLEFAFDYDFWLRLAKKSPPLYLRDRIACFRWYVTSKSGANFERQFDEDAAISARHGTTRLLLWRKQIKNRAIVAVYRTMTTMANLGRGREAKDPQA
jgi:glycosyltransferase involved in cell wall biosynthesis